MQIDKQIEDLIAMLSGYRDFHYGRGENAEGDMMQRKIDAIEGLKGELERISDEYFKLEFAFNRVDDEKQKLQYEVERYRTALIAERDEALKWDGIGTVNRINKVLGNHS